MKRSLLALAAAGLLALPGSTFADDLAPLMNTLHQLQKEGELTRAEELARTTLEDLGDAADEHTRRALEFEILRAQRIRGDYTVTEERLWTMLEEFLEDITPEEFEKWKQEDRFDVRLIDGERRFMNSSRANLMFRYPELEPRRKRPLTGNWDRFLWEQYEKARQSFGPSATAVGAPHDFRLTMTITVRENVVPAGETIRVWMPFAKPTESQDNIVLESTEPPVAYVNAPDYPQRSLYFEVPSAGAEPTVVTATWRMSTRPRRYEVDPARVVPTSPQTHPEHAWFTREQEPHIVFTPEIRALAEKLVGDETNPWLKAGVFYDWMAGNIQYSFACEYSTAHNISQSVLERRYGDCGELALLFMALCRASDIPARWQSGWVLYPDGNHNLHDWCEILIAPYGWVPIDVNYGIFARQRLFALTPDQKHELEEYYRGGLDAFRLIVNSDHQYDHYPPKDDFRSDTVDFQRGEVEANDRNLYYGDFRYRMTIEHLWQDADARATDATGGRPQGTNLAR